MMNVRVFHTDEKFPTCFLRGSVLVLGIALTCWTIYYAYAQPVTRVRFANSFLGIGLAVFYLDQALKLVAEEEEDVVEPDRGESSPLSIDIGDSASGLFDSGEKLLQRVYPAVLVLLAVVSLAATGYVEYYFDWLLYDAVVYGFVMEDIFVGWLLILLVTHATKRAYGWAITMVVIAAILYAYLGPYMPGLFHHTGMEPRQISIYGAIQLSGVYSFILEVGSTWVAIFIMFAGMAKAYGLMDFILEVGEELGNKLRTGVVHVAVISSLAMASITGSAAANTATTGSFTIPMMKQQGVRKDFAAAIESVASAGGQMMPPIMGVAAFLMADILGVSYLTIIRAGTLPALLFYFSVAVAVHLTIMRFGWTVEESEPFNTSMLTKGVHFLVPMGVLLYTLVVMRLTPLGAGLYTIIALVATMYIRDIVAETELRTVVETTKRTILGLRDGAIEMAPLIGVLASMGVIVEMVTQTGLSQKISLRMAAIAGGVLLFVLIMGMIASILFGLGMPTPAAYILVVILAAPGIIELGVRELTAHMFVFYFAMLSAITPPVAISVAVGSRIADADFLTSCKQAFKIGFPGFLIPYAFVVNDSIIYWSPMTLLELPIVLVSVLSISMASIGHNSISSLSWVNRVVLFALALVGMFAPVTGFQIIAVVGILLTTAASIDGKFTAPIDRFT